MDLQKTLKTYLDEISSNSPTPGGGNVSAFSGAVACSLGIMICNLTFGKKKYADVETEMLNIKDKLSELKDQFVRLAGEDNLAFDHVMEAFKLPKETGEQKAYRQQKIDEATLHAADIPGNVIQTCAETIKYLKVTAHKGNQNGVSDSAVAISLLQTAAQGAYMNVLINCTSLSNKTAGTEIIKRWEVVFNEVKEECDNTVTGIIQRILQ